MKQLILKYVKIMTENQYNFAKDIIWHDKYGPLVTCNEKASALLGDVLRSVGVEVISIGKKPHSRNKFQLFTIKIIVIDGDRKFLTKNEAMEWHKAKNRSLNTLMKAPSKAFDEPVVTESTELIWWSQAFQLAYRLGGNLDVLEKEIIKHRGALAGDSYGL